MIPDALRRLLDITIALLVLIVGAPVMLVISLAVCLSLGSPVLFVQERAGWHQRPFRLYKFRTMARPVPGREGPEFDDERLGPFGKFLRSTSLDELPGFLNLLKGDITLVGPRPLPVTYIPRYQPHELARFAVKPGFTGLAQINGRNRLNWDQRLALDAKYVATRSLVGDLVIILRTIPLVLTRRNINADGASTMSALPIDRASTR